MMWVPGVLVAWLVLSIVLVLGWIGACRVVHACARHARARRWDRELADLLELG